VVEIWPDLVSKYPAQITKPMDPSKLQDEGLHETLGEFKMNLMLIFTNSVTFNGADHELTKAAFTVVEEVWKKCSQIEWTGRQEGQRRYNTRCRSRSRQTITSDTEPEAPARGPTQIDSHAAQLQENQSLWPALPFLSASVVGPGRNVLIQLLYLRCSSKDK
jgi:hypothetical protein